MPNINVNGTLYPSVSSNPTHDDSYGYGGYRSVVDETALSAIPSEYRKNGMTVHVVDVGKTFMLDGGIWKENGFIRDGSLNGNKISNNSISGSKIIDGEIDENKIANDSISTFKIKDANITYEKLANQASIQILSPTSAFSGTSPTVATGIYLNQIISVTEEILALIRVETLTTSGATFNFGPSGDLYDAGIGTLTLGGNEKGLISTITGVSGTIEWKASSPVLATVDVVGFIR